MRLKQADYQPGHFYHIYNRGAHRHSIFREPENYLYVLAKMKKYAQELAITIIAYCLLPNHYHFLLRQDGEQPASLLPQRVFRFSFHAPRGIPSPGTPRRINAKRSGNHPHVERGNETNGGRRGGMTRRLFFLQNSFSPRHLAQNRPKLGETGGNGTCFAWPDCFLPVLP